MIARNVWRNTGWLYLAVVGVLLLVGLSLWLANVPNTLSAGQFSLGYLAAGDFSVGVFAAGTFAIGAFAAGIFAIGIFSVGIFSIGIWSIGLFALGVWAKGLGESPNREKTILGEK